MPWIFEGRVYETQEAVAHAFTLTNERLAKERQELKTKMDQHLAFIKEYYKLCLTHKIAIRGEYLTVETIETTLQEPAIPWEFVKKCKDAGIVVPDIMEIP